jgi:hypothetical protein
MPCLFCTEKKEAYNNTRSLRDEEYSFDFGYDHIVKKGNMLIEDNLNYIYLIECSDCHSIWSIESKSVYTDPRNAMPDYMDQKAFRLDEKEKKLILDPAIGDLITYKEFGTRLPKMRIIESIVKKIGEQKPEELKVLCEKNDPVFDLSLQYSLKDWYREKYIK